MISDMKTDSTDNNISGSEMAPKAKFHWIPGIIRNDFWRKLIALIFGSLVYYAVQMTQLGAERTITGIPVEVEIPENLINLSDKVPTVSVTVRGSQRRIKELSANDFKIKAVVKESDFVPDSLYVLRIDKKLVKSPHLITVLKVFPGEKELSLERKDRRSVEIKPDYNSLAKLPRDYTVSEVKFTPEKVWIIGPASQIRDIKSVSTKPIPLDESTVDSFEYEVKLSPPNLVSVTPDKVSATVTVKREYSSRMFKSVPLRVLGAVGAIGSKVELLSSPNVDITVNGPKGKIIEMKNSMIKPYIDMSGLDEPGTYTVTSECWLTVPGVSVKNIYPAKIKVKILQQAIKKK